MCVRTKIHQIHEQKRTHTHYAAIQIKSNRFEFTSTKVRRNFNGIVFISTHRLGKQLKGVAHFKWNVCVCFCFDLHFEIENNMRVCVRDLDLCEILGTKLNRKCVVCVCVCVI